ncbi:MAG: endolytic transglycosylase MltG [Bacteroidetes bacterium]|nr:endolytic transglycosylase MltG [Bacteroidota bacterium]
MKLLKKILLIFFFIAVGGCIWVYLKYRDIYSPNVVLENNDSSYIFIYIPTGSQFDDLIRQLTEKNIIRNRASFEWVAELKGLKYSTHPGRYRIRNGMSNNELVNLLRSGKQEPVRVTLFRIHTVEQLASKVSKKLESDSISLVRLLKDEEFLSRYNLNRAYAITLFLPNTYEFYWNTSAEQFIDRMAKEFKKFWSEQKMLKAKETGFSVTEITTLASIVEQETLMDDEKPIMAGVYINRLRKGWKLEADPTVIFAIGNFGIRRVLNVHKEIDSPYNTYKHSGLPPGPICAPSVASIDAVLNYDKNEYLYFCAKEDFSGYHSFAKTYDQHKQNARKFRKELDRRKIFN